MKVAIACGRTSGGCDGLGGRHGAHTLRLDQDSPDSVCVCMFLSVCACVCQGVSTLSLCVCVCHGVSFTNKLMPGIGPGYRPYESLFEGLALSDRSASCHDTFLTARHEPRLERP